MLTDNREDDAGEKEKDREGERSKNTYTKKVQGGGDLPHTGKQ